MSGGNACREDTACRSRRQWRGSQLHSGLFESASSQRGHQLRFLAVVLMMIAASSPAFADQGQGTLPPVKSGSKKIWTGVALIAAGAVVMPITGVAYVSQPVRLRAMTRSQCIGELATTIASIR